MSSPWYGRAEAADPLTQGDLVADCPVLTWRPDLSETNSAEPDALLGLVDALRVDVIVMTQACDLAHRKLSDVLLCPHVSLERYREQWLDYQGKRGQNPSVKAWRNHCDDICNGYLWNLAMLNRGEVGGMLCEHRIVAFDAVFTIPRPFLEALLVQRGKARIQLLPPYREHLSQAFARFFMRVGLPTPIEHRWDQYWTAVPNP